MVQTLERPMPDAAGALEFVLPPELEARVPPEARGIARDEVRLMVSHKANDRVEHTAFKDITRFLRAGDLVIVNDSATLPAALTAGREDGDEIAFHLSTELEPGLWVAEPRKTAVRAGERLTLPGSGSAVLLAPHRGSSRLWLARLELPEGPVEYLTRWGRPIKYDYAEGDWPISAYQTVYARRPGSAEMPSAGRAFSDRVLQSLQDKDVKLTAITLHTGVSSLEDHEPPYEEWFQVPESAAAAIAEARARGGRRVAVGTTVIRALESALSAEGEVQPASGWTDLVITPEEPVRSVDGLLTGFHEPRATHLAMLEAIAGRRHIELVYREALGARYLWHEFGDLHLVL
jgi:S-adenosylmethionine:tRNA ribosyltransferase-isomerase